MAKKIYAFNLKMNKPNINFENYIKLLERTKDTVFACAPYVYLNCFKQYAKTLKYGAQNVSEFEKGSHTGEVSANMLAEFGAKVCIVGHSDRRKHNLETDEQIASKIERLVENDILPIICVGEEKEFKFEKSKNIIKKQLNSLNLPKHNKAKIIIAYEPVWAIGTGKTPTIDYIEQMSGFIKNYIKENGLKANVLYGGSFSENNCETLKKARNVDGFLIGGASLKESAIKTILNLN